MFRDGQKFDKYFQFRRSFPVEFFLIMYSRISSRILYCCVVESKFSRSIPTCFSKTGNTSLISSIKCGFSNSSIRWSGEGANKALNDAYAVSDLEDRCSASELNHYDEEGDEFVDEDDDVVETINYEAITGNDPEKLEALKLVIQDQQKLREEGYPFLPNRIATRRWEALMNCKTFHERKECFRYLFVIEKKNAQEKERKKEKRKKRLEMRIEPKGKMTTSSPIVYRLNRNSLFYRKYNKSMHNYFNYRLAIAEWFGPHIIIDCGYESYMNMRELHHCCTQLEQGWTENRMNVKPLDIIFCNVEEDSTVFKKFRQKIPQVGTKESPVHFTEKHYMDLFPAEKLVYLSPHSEQVMEEYDPNSVYIIGEFKDKGFTAVFVLIP